MNWYSGIPPWVDFSYLFHWAKVIETALSNIAIHQCPTLLNEFEAKMFWEPGSWNREIDPWAEQKIHKDFSSIFWTQIGAKNKANGEIDDFKMWEIDPWTCFSLSEVKWLGTSVLDDGLLLVLVNKFTKIISDPCNNVSWWKFYFGRI